MLHFNSDVVRLIVGGPKSPVREPTSSKFYVHRSVLTRYSPVFMKMIQPYHTTLVTEGEWTPVKPGMNWIEAQSGIVTLEEDRVVDWAMLCRWMYADLAAPCRGLEDGQISGNSGLDLLDVMIREQGGLHDEELHRKVLANLLWRTGMEKSRVGRNSVAILKVEETECSNITDKDSRGSFDILETEHLVRSSSLSGISHSKEQHRPDPPALGSLIRLYILADKYGVVTPIGNSIRCCLGSMGDNVDSKHCYSLKSQIVLRLKAIHKLIRVLPDKGDVSRVWHNIPWAAEHDFLKMFILNVYAGLSVKNRIRILSVHSSHGENSDPSEWHLEFLRDLSTWRYERENSN